jgi:murein DD-endopeptidase MepM/ murein hydrolase activator NlpD
MVQNNVTTEKPAIETTKSEATEAKQVHFQEVKKGDNIGNILGSLRIESIDIYSAINALNKVFRANKIQAGDKLSVEYYEKKLENNENRIFINKINIYTSNNRKFEIIRTKKGEFFASIVNPELFSKLQVKSGQIKSSLYEDALKAGIPAAMIMEFIRFYSFDLDFQRDVRKGDKFQIFYESFYDAEGKFIKNGDIIYCKFISNGKELVNYKYTTTKGSTLYFDNKGSSIRKALLRTPISGAKISSYFGYRKHPILGYTKLHKGVDFAARTGTPIFASGNGTISFIGWKGGYGRYIKIRHNRTYSSAYAHLSRFASSLKNGSKVKQGQVIGYVGSTGRSTGPHLHYEVYKNGRAVNPRELKPESKVTLKDTELEKFIQHRDRIDFILKNAYAKSDLK